MRVGSHCGVLLYPELNDLSTSSSLGVEAVLVPHTNCADDETNDSVQLVEANQTELTRLLEVLYWGSTTTNYDYERHQRQ